MPGRAREHLVTLTALLTTLSLALIFGAVLGVVPASSLPAAPALLAAIPHLNAALSLAAIAAISAGWRAIRRGRVRRHRAAMLTATLLFAGFLLLYLYKVVIQGPTPFTGPATLYRFGYLPLLTVHIGLAVVNIPLLYFVLLVGLTHPVGEIPGTLHPRVGRVAAPLWLVSFTLGIVVYLLLYVVY